MNAQRLYKYCHSEPGDLLLLSQRLGRVDKESPGSARHSGPYIHN